MFHSTCALKYSGLEGDCFLEYCHVLGARDLLYWVWIGWLDSFTACTHHSELQLITALSLIYTLYRSPLHTIVLSDFTSLILATDLYQSHCHCSKHKVFFSEPNSFLAISSHSFSTADSRDSLSSSRCMASGRPQQKTPFPNNSSIVIEACLPRRCIETTVLLLLAYSSLQECVYEAVA
jgi:hypothetical protein